MVLLFRLYEKVTKKYTEGCGPLDSGERFKTRAVGFQMKFEMVSVLRFFAKIHKNRDTHGLVLNRCEREVREQTQNRVLWEIEVAVQA